MHRLRWLLVVLFVVLSSLLLAACGGDEDEAPGEGVSPASAGETPQASGDVGEFGDLAGKFAEATFKATYKISSVGGEEEGEGSLTWYKKGDNLRMDFESEVEGEQMNAVFIIRPDKSFLCTEIPEMSEGPTCFETPSESGGGLTEIVSGLDELLTNPDVEIVSTESREVAGQEVDCFVVRSPDAEEDSEVCMTRDGVPLATRSTAGSEETTMEATDFSPNVSDSDFEPPYPVGGELPGLSD